MHWHAVSLIYDFQKNHQLFGASTMSKEQKSNKKTRKASSEPKEKKAAKNPERF